MASETVSEAPLKFVSSSDDEDDDESENMGSSFGKGTSGPPTKRQKLATGHGLDTSPKKKTDTESIAVDSTVSKPQMSTDETKEEMRESDENADATDATISRFVSSSSGDGCHSSEEQLAEDSPAIVEMDRDSAAIQRDSLPESIEDDDYPAIDVCAKVRVARGDISKVQVHAVVNAANGQLWGGGGVCGAIFKATADASALQSECQFVKDTLFAGKRVPVGHCVLTGGYALCKYIIHAVGPIGLDEDKLKSCYKMALDICVNNGISKVVFPCISTGIFDYPSEAACRHALEAVNQWLIQAKTRTVTPHFKEAKAAAKFAAKHKPDSSAPSVSFPAEKESLAFDLIEKITFCTYQAKDYAYYKVYAPEIMTLSAESAAFDPSMEF